MQYISSDLKTLSSNDLITSAKQAAADERKATCTLIDHLREIEERLLYLELGFGSLFEFAVKELSLSEGSAHRRISAMRLARDVPELKEKLKSGTITLSNAAKVQVALNSIKKMKKMNATEKDAFVRACENLTQIECEEALFKAIPELAREPKWTESMKDISSELVAIRVVVSTGMKAKIDTLMKLTSHQNPALSIAVLIESLVNAELKREDKKMQLKVKTTSVRKSKTASPEPVKEVMANPEKLSVSHNVLKSQKPVHPAAGQAKELLSELKGYEATPPKENRKSFSAAVKKALWARSMGQCEFPNCKSQYQLQFDHIQAKALGGKSDLANGRVLCRAHNIFSANQAFGREYMGKFVSSLE